MKRILSTLAIAALAAFSMNAQGVKTIKEQDPSKHVVRTFPLNEKHLCFHSDILGVDKNFTVIFPKSYETDTDRKYPVVYLLHGFGENDWEWANINCAMINEVVNEAVSDGSAAEMIIVRPNATEYHSGYYNQPDWRYEDYFFQELIPTVEATFRCYTDKGHRAIGGLSMGGGGSLYYGFSHPEMFSSVYALSAGLAKIEPTDADMAKRLNSGLDITNLSPEQIEAAKTVAWVLDCGDDDPLLDGVIWTYQQMKKLGLNVQFRVGEGVHATYYWYNGFGKQLRFWTRHFSDQCK